MFLIFSNVVRLKFFTEQAKRKLNVVYCIQPCQSHFFLEAKYDLEKYSFWFPETFSSHLSCLFLSFLSAEVDCIYKV